MDLSAQRDNRHDDTVGSDSSTSYEVQLTKIEALREKLRREHKPEITEEDNWIKREYIDTPTLHANPELLKLGIFPTKILADRKDVLMRYIMSNVESLDYSNDNDVFMNLKDYYRTVKTILKTVYRIIRFIVKWVSKAFKTLVKVGSKLAHGVGKILRGGYNVARKTINKAINVVRKTDVLGKIASSVTKAKDKVGKVLAKVISPVKNVVGKSLAKIAEKVVSKKALREAARHTKELSKKAAKKGVKGWFKAAMSVKWVRGAVKLGRYVPIVGAAASVGFEFYDLWSNLESIQALYENGLIDDKQKADLQKYAYATSGATVGAEVATNLIATGVGAATTGVGALAGGVAAVVAGETARYTTKRILTKDENQVREWDGLLEQGRELLDSGYELKNEVKVDDKKKQYYEDLGKFITERKHYYDEQVKSGKITQQQANQYYEEDINTWTKANPNENERSEVKIDRNIEDHGVDVKPLKQQEYTPIPDNTANTSTYSLTISQPSIKETITPIPNTTTFRPNINVPKPQSIDVSEQQQIGMTPFTPIHIPTRSSTPKASTNQSNNSYDIPTEANDNGGFYTLFNSGVRN